MVPFGAGVSARRFLVAPESLKPGEVELPPGEAAHARKVLRLKPGEVVELIDGEGRRGLGSVSQADRKKTVCLVERIEDISRLKPRIVVCPALVKGPAMELLAVKLTELAVDEIRPVLTGHTVMNPASAKQERWQRLAAQALKQCGAGYPPLFHAPVSLAEMLESAPEGAAKLMLYESERNTALAHALGGASPDEVWILVGPEGGFTPDEADLAQGAGFIACLLPGPVLRAETASLAAASVVRFGLTGCAG